ncbi:hypothetical protein F4806DRAFT_466191 [Annulohypoxylon nitens]|nr:hypothetical protein F4806DRAFT_466191 [Annulohypoxylon nitens]
MTTNPQTIPQLNLQPNAVDFIDSHLSNSHPAFACHFSRYDPKFDRYISLRHEPLKRMQNQRHGSRASIETHLDSSAVLSPPEIILSMNFWDRVLPIAMGRLKEGFDEPKNRHDSGYSIRGLGNWDQVYQTLEDCYNSYMDDNSLIKKVKKGWREFTDRIGPIQEAWRLVPDVDYLTPVRGTLEFIIDAIRRASETRQKVIHGLDNLDRLFKDIELYLALFPTDINVQEAGISLVLSALVAVEKLIGFYLKPGVKKARSALFKGDDYEKDVIGSLQDILSKSEGLRFGAEKADMLQSTRNWNVAQQRHKDLVNIQETLVHNQNKLMQNQNSHSDNLTKTCQAINGVYDLMQEYERNQERRWQGILNQRISQINITIQRPVTPDTICGNGWCITPDDIWDIFSLFYFEGDIQHTIERQGSLPVHERAMTESLVANSQFRKWMVSPMSKELLIQGNLVSDRHISSQSIFCSTFLQALRGNSRFISLFYLCGLHSDYEDPHSGPRGMMMSLIAQLVLQWDFNTTGIHQAMDFLWDEYCEEPDINDICILASWLVVQLPADITVFCIMDGINAYEKEGYLPDLVCGLACILDWTIDPRVNATIKVLVTSPCRSLEVRQGFHDDAVLVMADQLGLSGEANQRLLQHRMSRAFRNEED